MIAWEHLASAEMPGGGALKLMRRGKEYSIKLDRVELMNSRLSGSEEALATMALERIGPVAAPHVLIGGIVRRRLADANRQPDRHRAEQETRQRHKRNRGEADRDDGHRRHLGP